ncbi:hypothetical protein D8M04_00305 [Oceanobacillus piezotolerans]|uniref:Uncharacterized protein n=1 Tax=Oceanobacillus piezotolerans TaxID=2448030 RepID=A0A498D9W5_9BACI|nr:hypothetical protein [Oceanobacillus piezotolerans]RLL47761.1 hypothetical protein D8M04_00305 [Oceanobacillus piezotolerans]
MKNMILIMILISVFAVVAFFDDFNEPIRSGVPIVSEENEESNQEVNASVHSEERTHSLEYRLEEKNIVDGYVIETYREYETYRDKEGKIIESLPTSKYDYLRYHISERDLGD